MEIAGFSAINREIFSLVFSLVSTGVSFPSWGAKGNSTHKPLGVGCGPWETKTSMPRFLELVPRGRLKRWISGCTNLQLPVVPGSLKRGTGRAGHPRDSS